MSNIETDAIVERLAPATLAMFERMLESWADAEAVEPEVTDHMEAVGLVRSVIATAADEAECDNWGGIIAAGQPMFKLTSDGKKLRNRLRAIQNRRASLPNQETKT